MILWDLALNVARSEEKNDQLWFTNKNINVLGMFFLDLMRS